MARKIKIAVAGAGLIGRRHIQLILQSSDIELLAIVDPSDQAKEYAKEINTGCFSSLSELFLVEKPDGVILATPNQLHVENGLEALKANCPILIEKPISTTYEEGLGLVEYAATKNIPVLVGHHRRYNPKIQRAKSIIDSGALGRVNAIQASCWMLKPDIYFEPAWRRQKGAGPVMVNAIHDIDLLRYLCGDIRAVTAVASNKQRGFDTEDTAAILLEFMDGIVGTVSISDTIAAPWSWEMTSGENYEFPKVNQSCYMIGGTKASLSVPDLQVWQHEGEGHWKQPMKTVSGIIADVDPLVAQIQHFSHVIKGIETPLVSGMEGLKSLRVIEAINQSAELGSRVLI